MFQYVATRRSNVCFESVDRDGLKVLHCVFVEPVKAYVRVPREELWKTA